VDGNTVRRTQAEPDYRRERRERIEREQELERRRRQRTLRRNHERELRMNRSYVVFMTMAVLVFGAFAGIYVHLQSDVTARMKAIASLESQIENVRADNDESYKRINTSVDLAQIRATALGELGMVYAKESQIIYYSVGEDDYMNQYSEIPSK
jgi:cell division protein FtsL